MVPILLRWAGGILYLSIKRIGTHVQLIFYLFKVNEGKINLKKFRNQSLNIFFFA
jgi:hypothetical protein